MLQLLWCWIHVFVLQQQLQESDVLQCVACVLQCVACGAECRRARVRVLQLQLQLQLQLPLLQCVSRLPRGALQHARVLQPGSSCVAARHHALRPPLPPARGVL